jgi:hypothetical protein
MKEDIKDIWLQALRSGDYKQGSGALKKGDSFCCLGVLCDLHSKITGMGQFNNFEYVTENHTSTQFLNKDVKEWSGMKSECGHLYSIGFDTPALATLNDAGIAFEQIADHIENYWESL